MTRTRVHSGAGGAGLRGILPLLVALLAACGERPDAGGEELRAGRSLDGTLVLAGEGVPPEGGTLHLRLLDVTVPSEPGVPLTSMLVTDLDGFPAPFSLPYGEGVIQRLRVYGLEATIEVDGEQAWRTPTPIPVLSTEMPDPLVVELQPASVAMWWDPSALDLVAEELDSHRDSLERTSGSGLRAGGATRWTAWWDDGRPVVIIEESDAAREGSVRAVYHLRNGRTFRYSEESERVLPDLAGETRTARSRLVLHFDPEGSLLRGGRWEEGAPMDLPPVEVDRVRSHLPVIEAAPSSR